MMMVSDDDVVVDGDGYAYGDGNNVDGSGEYYDSDKRLL